MAGHQTSVTAVTDAELEALEKQIEQQETEEKRQVEAEAKRKAEEEAKRKAEEKRKAEAEAEKKRLTELEKQLQEEQRQLEEQKRLEEEKRKAEEARLVELERQRREEEAKKREEEVQISGETHVPYVPQSAYLGVLIQDVTPELAEALSMGKPHGALVARVQSDSPAEKAGLEVGDVIVKFNNQNVSSASDLRSLVGSSKFGTHLPVEIMRRGMKRKLKVTLSQTPDFGQATTAPLPENSSTKIATFGKAILSGPLNIMVQDLTDMSRKKLGVKHGVLVQEVNTGPGQNAGITVGDIILTFNHQLVLSTNHFNEFIRESPQGKSILIRIQRKDSQAFLVIKMEK